MKENHYKEIAAGDRFRFGENWRSFLETLNEERIEKAISSLQIQLDRENLSGLTFLDAGSGSGLFSLAARRLGATVHSFDFDPESVACARTLKDRYYSDDEQWKIEEGSVLDADYLDAMIEFDVVYSWGVLHHTGDMWSALENITYRVKPGGKLFISIYNDQGGQSRRWKTLKKYYNKTPKFLKVPYTFVTMGPREVMLFLVQLSRGKPQNYTNNIKNYSSVSLRGMNYWHDIFDWIGGYPFEVAKPEEIFNFYREKKFNLKGLSTMGGGLGCNEFVFQRDES